MGHRPTNKAPSEDPLIFAIERGRTVGPDVLELAITYRLAQREQLDREIRVLERAHAEALAVVEG